MFRIASKYFLKANPKPYYLFKKNLRGIASSVQEKSTYKLNIRMQELFQELAYNHSLCERKDDILNVGNQKSFERQKNR